VKNKVLRQKLAFATLTPVFVPGFIFYTSIHGYFDKVFILFTIFCAGLYLFIKYYKFFVKSEGFIKRLAWAFILVNTSMGVVTFAPESNNAFAGAALFLYLPSMIISINILINSKAAHNVAMQCKKCL
jgi:hypothetical protein